MNVAVLPSREERLAIREIGNMQNSGAAGCVRLANTYPPDLLEKMRERGLLLLSDRCYALSDAGWKAFDLGAPREAKEGM